MAQVIHDDSFCMISSCHMPGFLAMQTKPTVGDAVAKQSRVDVLTPPQDHRFLVAAVTT